MKALEAGLTPAEVSEIVGAGNSSVTAWARAFRDGGMEALVRKSTSATTRRICEKLERRIEQERRENPESGVRRIRDELKRHEGLGVSAETVRRVVNDAGLGNPPAEPGRKPAGVRRFEKELPNALWQIDIFTFQLKRMYRVYLVGIIDDRFAIRGRQKLLGQIAAATVLIYFDYRFEIISVFGQHFRNQMQIVYIIVAYGWILIANDQPQRGLRLLERAAEKAPDNADIRYHLAATYAKVGEKEAARKELESLLDSDEEFSAREEAQSLLEELR